VKVQKDVDPKIGKKGHKKLDRTMQAYALDAHYKRLILGAPSDPKTHVPKLLEMLRKQPHDEISEIVKVKKIQLRHDDAKIGYKSSLKDPEFVGALFQAAIEETNSEIRSVDRSMVTAFERAGLDIGNPLDWRRLMKMFCWAHYGQLGNPGKQIDWTAQKYYDLLRDVHDTKKKLKCKEDATALRDLLKNKFEKYPYSYDRLKKALSEARNPDFNLLLTRPTDEPLHEDTYVIRDGTLTKAAARLIADRIGAGDVLWAELVHPLLNGPRSS
jgi:hypothetical protein